ncbi:exported hypothetical protein [Verrucomicrobia bacterium]|nr:exported hypothetical protein [Verrucomicrobiota bacterium]
MRKSSPAPSSNPLSQSSPQSAMKSILRSRILWRMFAPPRRAPPPKSSPKASIRVASFCRKRGLGWRNWRGSKSRTKPTSLRMPPAVCFCFTLAAASMTGCSGSMKDKPACSAASNRAGCATGAPGKISQTGCRECGPPWSCGNGGKFFREVFQQEEQRLRQRARYCVEALRNRLAAQEARLRLLGPEQVLARGYSITSDAATGRVLRNASEVTPGQRLKTRLKAGAVLSRAEESSR